MEKVVANYTVEQEAELAQRYAAGETPEQLAVVFGKSVRSVIAKLSRMGIYVSKPAATAHPKLKKADLVSQIANSLGVDVEVFRTFEKADKAALEVLAEILSRK